MEKFSGIPSHDPAYFSSKTPEEVLSALRSDARGLSDEAVEARRRMYGENRLDSIRRFDALRRLLRELKNPLMIILLAAAAISFFLGEVSDAVIITVMVLMSVLLDFFEEYSANRAAEKLRQTVRGRVTVCRNGQEREIFAQELTPGDIVLLSAGNVVPADGRVLFSDDCYVNESVLTGESFPVPKIAEVIPGTPEGLDAMRNLVFMGSSVLTGSCRIAVFATGKNTQFGHIARSLGAAEEDSAFGQGVHRFGMLILRLTLLLVLFIFMVNLLKKQDYMTSFMFSLAVAVGLTPELLPMIMSVTMARGSLRMAKQGAIVKKLSAIPDFGGMDILCTDKTGTLTQDHIQLVRYVDLSGNTDETVLLYAFLNSHFQAGLKNPLDEAVLQFRQLTVDGHEKLDELPFDFVRKKLSVVLKKDGEKLLITKGAPEEIFACCTGFGAGTPKEQQAQALYDNLSQEGFRVLALAIKALPAGQNTFSKDDEKALEFVGFIAFLDPPKEGVGSTLASLRQIGIEVKVITGDNELVTRKICAEIGLPVKGVLHGHDIEHLSPAALRVRAEKTTIFARFSPEQKNRVIQALRAGGHIVGYLGDGINDAPSLQSANVGISVNNATDVAKESADFILTEKSLAILQDAVIEGRKTFGNTVKYIQMGLSSNFGNMFSVAAATIFLPFLPMLPIQILLNNFLYDFSQITIPTDRVDTAYVQRPKQWDIRQIRRFMVVFGLISSVFDLLTFYLFYQVFQVRDAAFQTAWFMESLATQTLVIHVIRTQQIPFLQSTASMALLLSTFAAVAAGWVIPYTALGAYFGMIPLPPGFALVIVALVIVYLIAVEIAKRFFFRKT